MILSLAVFAAKLNIHMRKSIFITFNFHVNHTMRYVNLSAYYALKSLIT